MHIMSPPFWLMIVSRMMAVFPVCRSPMISSRCPRPMGIIESMALMPVCSGSRTGWRSITPGAMRSIGSAAGGDGALAVQRLAQRIYHAAHHGVAHRRGHDRVGALDRVALFESCGVFAQQHGAHLIFFQVQRDAIHVMRKSSISPAITFSRPCMRAMPSPTEMTVPTSSTATDWS